MSNKKLHVLVVDDSAHNRRTIADVLNSHPDIEVVGYADDGEKALKAAAQLRPDLIMLDLEMPRMDGFTFLRIIMSQMPTPVIVVSSQSKKQSVFQVLELGALDFIAKPARYFDTDPQLRQDIISKALAVKSLQVMPFAKRAQGPVTHDRRTPPPKMDTQPRPERLVCIGASTGGPPALQSIFKAVDQAPSTAFLVSQHMPEKFTRAFAERLNRISNMQICEAESGMVVQSGHVYIAPGGSHLELIGTPGAMQCLVAPMQSSDRYAPSIDRLFSSSATVARGKLLAVVLTGMGADGSEGVRSVYNAGGRVLAESEETAIVFGMPKEAAQTGCVHSSLPLEAIITQICDFARDV